MLRMRDLTLAVGSRVLMSGAHLSIEAGEEVGLTGANGVGKSTLLRTAAGFEQPAAGEVRYGKSVTDRAGGVRNGIGYAPATLDAPGRLTVAEFIEMVMAARGLHIDASVKDLVGQLGIDSVLGSTIDVLSMGERKKVSIAAAFMHRPALALCDEPYEALDDDSAAAVRRVIGAFVDAGGAAVVCTHRHRFLRGSASRIVTVAGGRLKEVDVHKIGTGDER